MQYQPSANEKASRASAQSSQLPNLPPRIHRSQSANDAAAGVYGSYMYGDTNNPSSQYDKNDPRYQYYATTSGAQTYSDAYARTYDAHGAYGYHQYAAEQAPTDEAAAYHQYHAQQAAMQHAQQQQQQQQQQQRSSQQHTSTLSPIYDHSHQSFSYNYTTHQSQQPQPPQQPSSSSTHRHYSPTHNSPPHHSSTTHGQSPPKTTSPLYPSSYQSHISKQTTKTIIKHSKDDYKLSLNSASDDKLPPAATKLQHAATTGFYVGRHAPPAPASSDLRFELEQIQNAKNLKRIELDTKRKKLISSSQLSSAASKELEETKKKWNLERETIIKSYGGKIPSFVIESDQLRKDLNNMSNRNSALQASLEVISNHLQTELYQLQYQLKCEKEISDQTHEHNIELERRVRELRIEKLELETELKTEQDKLINMNSISNSGMGLSIHPMGIMMGSMSGNNKNGDKFKEYPPESTVIQNLLQAQVEFYFSDYNLKRDKRLLSDVVKPPRKGFLKLEEVMKLSRIRQLCSEIETLEEALRRSSILTLIREEKPLKLKIETNKIINEKKDEKNDEKKDEKKDEKDEKKDNKKNNKNSEKKENLKGEKKEENDSKYLIWVGRTNFEKPREKEFPFRRTVFIFGIPMDGSESFLHEMLKPFGTVSKIQFDHSPDGIDRKIGIRFLNKPRVYILYYYDPNGGSGNNNNNFNDDEMLMSPNREQMIFKTTYDISTDENINSIKCHKCGKDKSVSEGFYTTKQWKVIYCAQCAAQLAEDQLNVYYKERNIPQYQHNPRHKWLGLPPNDMQKRKTALVVFASQRQASKCAYVRTRIAYKGAFATHFHHYSKVKKEIVLSESDQNDNKNKGNNSNNPNKNNQNNKNKSGNKSQSNSPNKSGRMYNSNKNKNKNQNNRRNRGQNRGRGQRYNQHQNQQRYNNNQQMGGGYMNYAQQQAAYYNQQQPPQQHSHSHSHNQQPKIYRQNSAPTGH